MRNPEARRLQQDQARTHNWKRWGPYLSERQWGTVREDYSPAGTCWNYFPHDHARSRAYRWGEDGLLGIADRQARLCFALALWNGNDPILKERLYGLNGHEGNHGEDVKELYYYLDSSPTHSYLKALYKYPHQTFPYSTLLRENRHRGRSGAEFELWDTGIFNDARYFDVQCEYAKKSPNDILIRIQITNRAATSHILHLLPTLWFRNTWSWGCDHEGCTPRPGLIRQTSQSLLAAHPTLKEFWLFWERPADEVLLTHNETNARRLYGAPDDSNPFVKDAFHEHLISRPLPPLASLETGTKAAPCYRLAIAAGAVEEFRLRLTAAEELTSAPFGPDFNALFTRRRQETDAFYHAASPQTAADNDTANIIRQGYAGLLWSKQFYHYVVDSWLEGDPAVPPPAKRKQGRNRQWRHFYSRDIISMPDKWEYPWFAAWDLAFHMIPFARIDPAFAKSQLLLMLREWYLHPNGQLPAYEFAFGDVNPPVHAWAVWRVYKITAKKGARDRDFLESAFQKLLLNFTWWVNRKDKNGNNLFGGGFLGLDNIGPFDRSQPFPGGGQLTQADGTAWMAFYCLTMLSIALELAKDEERLYGAYGDMASKFFEHFVQISDAFNHLDGTGLWDEQDGFYYDRLTQGAQHTIIRTRSLVGLLPLIAVEVLDLACIRSLPGFYKRFQWFLQHRPELSRHLVHGKGTNAGKILLMLSTQDRLKNILKYLVDEHEFLSPFGIRSLSKHHQDHPYRLPLSGQTLSVEYTPGESNTALFGGNSNWRGPIWLPVNYLLLEALERYQYFYGDSLTIPFPTQNNRPAPCRQIATEIQKRLAAIFRFNTEGNRPCHGPHPQYRQNAPWENLLLFYEYFDGDNARGLGASHQTGWTALIVRLLEDNPQPAQNP